MRRASLIDGLCKGGDGQQLLRAQDRVPRRQVSRGERRGLRCRFEVILPPFPYTMNASFPSNHASLGRFSSRDSPTTVKAPMRTFMPERDPRTFAKNLKINSGELQSHSSCEETIAHAVPNCNNKSSDSKCFLQANIGGVPDRRRERNGGSVGSKCSEFNYRPLFLLR